MVHEYPGTICAECGQKHGRKDAGRGTTWYPGTCDICGTETNVTEPRDFGHLKLTWVRAAHD